MKVKFFNFKSLVTYVTIVAFYFATTLSAQALPLRPISLAQMYSLASQGNVRALRAAVQRGMNIDATDRYGNTGLCHAIYQNNYTAYNAFHASGANPRHPCIQNIPPEQYDYFMASSRATPITATPRDAYKEFADGEFIFSTTTWVVGGLLLAGGIAALALGGGGGGSSHPYYFPSNDVFTPTDDSLGALVGTETPSNPISNPYTPVKIINGKNTEDFTLDNDSQILVDEETKNLTDVINFNDSVLAYTPYLQVGMKAIDGHQVVNGDMPLTGSEVGTTITLKNNTIGMAALHNAGAINNNTLKIIAKNGTIGMVGSDHSIIRNNGNIDISFKGNAVTDQVNGMYVDTSSEAINDGNITGNVTSDSAAGTLIGMQARLINQVRNPEGTIPVKLTNNKTIELSSTAANDQTISNSLVGMGSYLEKDFLEGTKLVRRTDYVEMTNAGVIDINVNLGDSGTYDSSETSLYNGTGGFIGMRADAHTTAYNNGSINLTIAPESASSVNNAHAGMLSVHGGTITNKKDITIEGGIGGYGMLGIRGEGTNSEFNTLNPTLVNSEGATITVNSVDGFGMATRHGGTVTNLGSIAMGEKGTGLQVNAGTGLNKGLIELANSGIGMAIRKNTTSEEGTVNNASTASITNDEGAVITIDKANGASGMFIEDGKANNDGTININGSSATTTESSYGIQAENGMVKNTGDINMNVLLSGDAQAYGIYGGNSAIVDNTGNILFTHKGIGTYTTNGTNTNSGIITMNGIGSTGMSSDSGKITNAETGQIIMVSGTGIQSNTGQVINQGNISITNGSNSIGITTSSDILNEENAQISITGANSTGILIGENGTATNDGEITLNSNQDSTKNYGLKSEGGANASITNNGTIALNGYNYDVTKEVGYGMYIVDGQATNNNTISIDEMYGYGMASDSGKLTNNGTITLTNGGYGIQSQTGSVFNSQGATITITSTPSLSSSYGIGVETGTAQNSGTINVSGNSENTNNAVYGIYVNGGNGINNSIINMYANNSYGLYDAAGGAITNTSALGQIATINLYGNNSVGMQANSGIAENFGTINVGVQDEDGTVQGGKKSTGMIANTGGTAFNTGVINLNGENGTAMYANGGKVQNTLNGEIYVNGNNSTVFKTSNGGTAINDGKIIVNADNYELFSSTDENGGTFINNGAISADSSDSKIIVAGNGTDIDNSGNIDLTGNNSYIMYVQGTGTVTNSGTLTIKDGSNNSYGIYMDSTASGNAVNEVGGNIDVNGMNSAGMFIASSLSQEGITNKGKITVTGNSSVGMGSSASAPITNSGTIDMQAGSDAINAAGGTISNTSTGKITTAENSTTNGINVTSGSTAATITNDGTITINGSGNAIMADLANVTNSSTGSISVNGGYGIYLASGSVSNDGLITVSGNGGTGIENGGSVINGQTGEISVLGDNAKGINIATGGTGTNNNIITVSGNSSSGFYVSGGLADNFGTITIDGDGSSGFYVTSGSGYNLSNINVSGENAIGMTASNGLVENGKNVQNEETQETELVSGTIQVTGTGGVGMKLLGSGSVLNNQGSSITINGAQGIGMLSTGSGVITNQGTISLLNENTIGMKATQGTANNSSLIEVNGANSFGLYADGGSVTNTGTLDLNANNGVGILVNNGSGVNSGIINLSSQGSIGLQANGGTATNSADLTVDGIDAVGLYAHGGTVNNNNATISLSEGGKAAIWVDAGTGYNNGIIKVTAKNASGILVAGGNAYNKNTINVSANSSYGMFASAGAATNNKTISVTGANAIGMGTSDSGKSTNSSQITVSVASGVGMFADGGLVTNGAGGTIKLELAGAKGMVANIGGEAVNSGTIDASIAGTIAMYANGGKITNSGIITGSADSTYLMLAENGGTAVNTKSLTFNGKAAAIQANAGSSATNEGGTITITGNNASGMIANGSRAQATNTGTINVQSGNGYAMLAQNGGSVTNSKTITYAGTKAAMQANAGSSATNNDSVTVTSGVNAMVTDGGTLTNGTDGVITLSASGAQGMVTNGGTATNNGTITATTSNTLAMYANGGTVINAGEINGSNSSQYLMLAENGGIATNQGTLSFNGTKAALQANAGSSVTNDATGTITVTGNGASGMIADGSGAQATNAGTINVQGGNGYAMLAQNGGSVTNGKTITYAGTKTAIQANAGSRATNDATGTITVTGNGASGMIADGSGAQATNAGTINVQSGNGYAMLAQNGGSVINSKKITYTGTKAAMQANAGSTAQNSGTIDVTNNNGNNAKGMIASSTGATAKVTNLAGGVINISGSNGVGMYADGSGAQAVNLGTININTTSSTVYGMQAVNGGSVENVGTINMMSGAQGIGIYVGSGSKFYNNASGKIIFAGGATQSGTITADTSSGDVTICEDGGDCKNKFIYLAQGASLVNSGTMVTSSSFALNEMGNGEVVLTSTGKMKADDSITGNLFIASDSAMSAQGQKDVYVNENALDANEIDVSLMSKSPMWNVSLQNSTQEPADEDNIVETDKIENTDNSSETTSNQEQNIVYNRVGFDKLVNNASQAAYLEANYAIRNSIYDGMIIASSQEEFNRAVQEGLGLDLIPNFAKQNMDLIRNVNRQVNSAVFNNTDETEIRTTIGYDFFDREQDGNNGLSGYEDEAHSGYALWDRKYNENFRYGIGASFTKYDSDYDNGSERNEIIAQIMTPLLFEAGNTQFLSMPKIGMGWGEYTRYAQGKEYKADTRNYYYGINNEVRHDIDMGIVTLEPVAEFNVLGLYQNRTKENIRVESNNNVSVEGGLGLYAKKSFSLTDEDELKIRLGGTYYHEFNNPYQAPKAGVVGLLGSYQMDSYEAQKDRAVLSARFDYKRGKFNFYLEGNSYIEDDDNYSINAGLTYAF